MVVVVSVRVRGIIFQISRRRSCFKDEKGERRRERVGNTLSRKTIVKEGKRENETGFQQKPRSKKQQ